MFSPEPGITAIWAADLSIKILEREITTLKTTRPTNPNPLKDKQLLLLQKKVAMDNVCKILTINYGPYGLQEGEVLLRDLFGRAFYCTDGTVLTNFTPGEVGVDCAVLGLRELREQGGCLESVET